jgi:hypothetical protein
LGETNLHEDTLAKVYGKAVRDTVIETDLDRLI